jgi:hypothetical protein
MEACSCYTFGEECQEKERIRLLRCLRDVFPQCMMAGHGLLVPCFFLIVGR